MRNNLLRSLVYVFSLAVILSSLSCHNAFQTVGKTVSPEEFISVPSAGKNGIWQTSDLMVQYRLADSDGYMVLSGTVRVKDSVIYSYPVVRFLRLSVNVLDGGGAALSRHDVGLNVPHLAAFSEPISFNLRLPPGVRGGGIAFSYWGVFREKANIRGSNEEWEIYWNPFTQQN